MEGFYESYGNTFEVIDFSISKGYAIPSLILIYTIIDSYSWLCDTNNTKSVSKRFTDWVDTWLLPTRYPKCTARDLYAARCGILHSLTSDSDKSNRGFAKKLVYSWGDANEDDLNKTLAGIGKNGERIVVHLNKLIDALKIAGSKSFEYIMSKPELKTAFETKASSLFSELSKERVQNFNLFLDRLNAK
jgi:hypothetical protein